VPAGGVRALPGWQLELERQLGLSAGDEVLSTNLEYGALDRTWEHVCGDFGARYVRAPVPLPVAGEEEVVEALWSHVGHGPASSI
jgi:isopenicillin-N epimerase